MRKKFYIAAAKAKKKQREEAAKGALTQASTSATNRHVTEQEKAVLAFIGKRGCVNLGAIQKHLWQDVSIAICKARLQKLVNANYVKPMAVDVRKEHKEQVLRGKVVSKHRLQRIEEDIYYLDRRARRVFSEKEWEGMQRKPPPLPQVDHMLKAGAIIDEIAKANTIIDYSTEISLRSKAFLQNSVQGMKLFDLSVTTQSGSYPIEVDSVNYTGRKLAEKARGLGMSGQQGLWVVYSQARLHTVSQAVAAYPNIQPILFSSLSKVSL